MLDSRAESGVMRCVSVTNGTASTTLRGSVDASNPLPEIVERTHHGRGASAPANPLRIADIGTNRCPAIQPARPVAINDACWLRAPAAPPAPPAAPLADGVTIADVASFAPDPGALVSQPSGWGVVGIDTNFYATASAQVKTGVLLARPVQVRFTPVAFRFDYGDGSARETATAGATWDAARAREFDRTATSHVYRQAGDYSAELTVRLRAEYSFDGAAWATVPGTLDLPTDPIAVHIGTVDTYLVDHPCTAPGSGPGC